MGGMSLVHWLLVGGIVLILFGGKGKISEIMGDVAKGIKSFKKGLSDDDGQAKPDETPKTVDYPKTIEHQAPTTVEPARDPNKAA